VVVVGTVIDVLVGVGVVVVVEVDVEVDVIVFVGEVVVVVVDVDEMIVFGIVVVTSSVKEIPGVGNSVKVSSSVVSLKKINIAQTSSRQNLEHALDLLLSGYQVPSAG
jgi:hypothetical protein